MKEEKDGGVEVIADGALCTCQGASSPVPVSFRVLSQQKVLCNGGSKLVATTNDNNIANVNFGSCSVKNNAPCTCTIQWQGFYKDIDLGGLKIMTMNTEGLCQGQKIGFKTCGQTESVAPPAGTTPAEAEAMAAQNPLVTPQDLTTPRENVLQQMDRFIAEAKEIMAASVNIPLTDNIPSAGNGESTLSNLQDLINAQLPELGTAIDDSLLSDALAERIEGMEQVLDAIRSLDIDLDTAASDVKGRVKKIYPVTYKSERKSGVLKQPINEICEFAVDTNGTLNWIVWDENKNKVFENKGGTKIRLTFPGSRNSAGVYLKYIIEAYGGSSTASGSETIEDFENKPATFFNTLVIQPVENEFTLKADKTECVVNKEVTVSVEKLFTDVAVNGSVCDYEVRKANIPVTSDAAEISRQSSDGAVVLFKQTGSYVITAKSSLTVHPTKAITVKKLLVEKVLANGQTGTYKAKKGEKLDFSVKLNFSGEDDSGVKWEVCHTNENKDIPLGTQKPQAALFAKAGTYNVYAFLGNGKAEHVKVVIEITDPAFEKIEWEDANGNKLKEIGKREKLYARITLKAASGVDFQVDLYTKDKICRSYTEIARISSWEKNGSRIILIPVEISDLDRSAVRTLKNGDLLTFKIKPSVGSVTLSDAEKTADFPIKYITKEKITSLKFYKNKECTAQIQTATYGDTIYAKALSRNLSGDSLRLQISRRTPGKLWDSSTKLFEKTENAQEDGSAVFAVEIKESWANKGNDYYRALIAEANNGCFDSTSELHFDEKSTDLHMENVNAMLGKIVDAEGKVITKVQKVEGTEKSLENAECTKCKEDLTVADLLHINGNSTPAAFRVRLDQIIKPLNIYMKAFGINDNCLRRAHFLGQVAKETGFWNLFEDFIYKSVEQLNDANFPNKNVIIAKEYYKKPKENEVRIANVGYGTGKKADDLKNTHVAESDWNDPEKDGYKYRGRGLIQLTGKGNYISFQKWYNKHKEKHGWAKINFEDDPDKLSTKEAGNKISDPEMMVLSAIYFWDANKLNQLADKGEKEKDTEKISEAVNSGQDEKDKTERHNFFVKALERIKDTDICKLDAAKRVPLTATDIITYHTYAEGKIHQIIPKENKYPGHYKYVYHDKNGTIHNICVVKWLETFKAENGKFKNITSLPAGYDETKTRTIPSGDAKKSYYYYENDKLVRIVTKGSFDKRPYVSFNVTQDKVILIRMPDKLNYKKEDVHIELIWSNTMRRYTSPENFAAFIGGMAECGFSIRSTGTAFEDATGYPSVTHVNGASIDVAYSSKSKDLAIMNAMKNFGYDKKNILTGVTKYYGDISTTDKSRGHEDHIHFGPKVPPVIILQEE